MRNFNFDDIVFLGTKILKLMRKKTISSQKFSFSMNYFTKYMIAYKNRKVNIGT